MLRTGWAAYRTCFHQLAVQRRGISQEDPTFHHIAASHLRLAILMYVALNLALTCDARTVGYTGGRNAKPSYESVCGGDGHTEDLELSCVNMVSV